MYFNKIYDTEANTNNSIYINIWTEMSKETV